MLFRSVYLTPTLSGYHNSTINCYLSRKIVKSSRENYVKMFLAARSTAFLTAKTRKDVQIVRYERGEKIFPRISKLTKILRKLKNKKKESRMLAKKPWKWLKRSRILASNGTHMPRVTFSFDQFNFVLPDSDPGKLYVIPKCFRDTDTTAKFVFSNSSSKNSDPSKYANSGKPKILKIYDLNSNAS